MQMIYEQMLGGTGGEDTLSGLIDFAPEDSDDAAFIEALVGGVSSQALALDQQIAKLSRKREIDRIPRVVVAILRLALHELSAFPDTPASVVINEAVELAKRYGDEGDSRFVNGLLGSVVRGKAE